MPSAPQNRACANGRSLDTFTTETPPAGGALVELANARRAHRGVDGRKDVQQHGLTLKLLAVHRAQIRSGQGERGRLGADGRQLADGVDRVSAQSYLCHADSLPSSAHRDWGGVGDQ